MKHDEVESLIHSDGREVLRRLFQAHLDLRARDEERGPMRGADGEVRSHQRSTERRLKSLLGGLTVRRLALSARGASGALRPLDAELNLPDDLYSFGLRRQIAELTARNPFEEVVSTVSSMTGVDVPKRQVEEVARKASEDFDAFYDLQDIVDEGTDDLLVLTFDGKGIVMRPDSLRESTRRAAEKAESKLKRRRSPGEKPRKRMAQVAAVYSLAVVPRTPEDVAATLKPPDSGRPARPRPKNKRVWASVTDDPIEVIDDAFHAAILRDQHLHRRWVVLVDGDPRQIDRITGVAKSYGVKPTIVVDLIHVLEYLWKAAWCLFEKGDREAEAWVEARMRRLLEGRAAAVAAGIRRSATRLGLSEASRAPMDRCADYLLKYKQFLRYDAYLRDGLPIATGVIEGACRYLIKDRMDRTGARWSLEGAEAVLRLRALHASGDFTAYWRFHHKRELERNHLDHYAADELAPLRQAA